MQREVICDMDTHHLCWFPDPVILREHRELLYHRSLDAHQLPLRFDESLLSLFTYRFQRLHGVSHEALSREIGPPVVDCFLWKLILELIVKGPHGNSCTPFSL